MKTVNTKNVAPKSIKAINALNRELTRSKKLEAEVKKVNAAAAKAKPHPYRVDGDGCPCPLELKDVPRTFGLWEEASGRALVFDLFNWREVLTEQQANDNVTFEVRRLMGEAAKELAKPYDEEAQRIDRRTISVGVLEGFADLVAHALELKEMREYMAQNLSDNVQLLDVMQAEERAEALNIHGTAHPEGGPLHE